MSLPDLNLGGCVSLLESPELFYSSSPTQNRGDEVEDIFGSNGHDVDGTHFDVSLAVNGNKVNLLPINVFTPVSLQKRIAEKYSQSIEVVKNALVNNGFRIHKNETESHQIHCDLASTILRVEYSP